MKQYWLDSVAHVHAQDAAWFFIFCVAIVLASVYAGIREDRYERR